ncbi:mTERF domain-containing mitochondrial [Micractinium conductrix]|uniref:mTERF domain-containing mitochondrial n=1 Tax=Micractinium conductrix TaxID=554055 RepID=A0A2P6V989_9CHLO|nr:mTERF domain-containing mitochondrial [Micractinium conductrix]|eukprot:PSC70649.1 mTERF domain-containing mitochondrial [Micractinium conductrix]
MGVAGGAGSAQPPVGGGAGAGAAAAAGAGAGKAAGKAAAGGAGLGAWWNGIWSKHAPAVEQQWKSTVTNLQKAKSWSMPVDVKVDFLNPTIETVKASVAHAWSQLPPPVQQAAPFVGVAAGSGLLVFAIQQRRIHNQRHRSEVLEMQLVGLQKERKELLKRVDTLKSNRAPRTEVEARLANAVAEATNAAAAAADAAARAATACIIQRP